MFHWIRTHRLVIICLITVILLLLYWPYKSSSKFQVKRIPKVRKEAANKISGQNQGLPIYIVGAYLIRADFLRVILVTDCRTTVSIYASFSDGRSTVKVQSKNLTAINDGCPYKYSPPCVFDGMYAEFEFLSKLIGDEVSLDIETEYITSSVKVMVQQSVPSSQRPHRLAVCLAALFYYADTVQLIEFIENWLFAGATKFFVYWQAITPAVQKVLNFYKESGVDIELVAWPHLYNESADLLFYYTGQVVSINDCLHKARSQAEFAATVDLDELIVISNGTNLLALLNTSEPNSVGWRISRGHAHYENEPTYATDPRLLSFAPLSEIHNDNPSSAMDKLILRPQNVRRSFVHWVNEREPSTVTDSGISSAQATLIHLRSIPEKVDQKNYAFSKVLDKIAQNMTENWRRRLNSTPKLHRSVEITRGIAGIAQLMEACLFNLKGKMYSTCFTASYCVPLVTSNATTVVNWQYPEKEWIEI